MWIEGYFLPTLCPFQVSKDRPEAVHAFRQPVFLFSDESLALPERHALTEGPWICWSVLNDGNQRRAKHYRCSPSFVRLSPRVSRQRRIDLALVVILIHRIVARSADDPFKHSAECPQVPVRKEVLLFRNEFQPFHVVAQ